MKKEVKTTFKKLLFDDLKSQGRGDLIKKIKSVRYESYSGGSSLNVSSENMFLSEREFMKNLLTQYTYGKFDGMYDIFNYHDGPDKKPRTVKYAFLRNEFSQDIQDRIKDRLKNEWGITNDQECQVKRFCWYDQAIHRDLSDLEALS